MTAEHVDVLIIGAGLSGIGAGCHLSKKCPDKNYLILEARSCLGVSWDSAEAKWTVYYQDKLSGENREISCDFINSCTGYYNYEHGYQPELEGKENYQGIFVYPQQWPENLDYKNKRVLVIGSGATAVTLVPEMSPDAAHVTMLQRSPIYMVAVPDEDRPVIFLRKFLPEIWAYRISRTLKVGIQAMFYSLSRRFPNAIRKLLLGEVKKRVGPNVDMKHFRPHYNPWDERLCAVKSGDLLEVVKNGSVSIVTDHIDHLTETGIKLKSGDELEADIIVSATGLDLKFFGDISILVDGTEFRPSEQLNYKGVMLEGLPNIGFTFGYTNASWTLKADLKKEISGACSRVKVDAK